MWNHGKALKQQSRILSLVLQIHCCLSLLMIHAGQVEFSVFITVSTGVPLMLVVVWARYSEQDFSVRVLLKVLTLPKGREKCVQPLKHTSSGINSHPLKYAHAHKHTTVCSGCRHGVRWALKNRLKRPSPVQRFCFQCLPRSILQPVPSPAEDGGVVVSVEMTFFKGISRPFISIS